MKKQKRRRRRASRYSTCDDVNATSGAIAAAMHGTAPI